jgi:hypothetical protein
LTWKGNRLFRHGKRTPVALIEPDKNYPGMWRFRLLPAGEFSDMVNLSRTKDAAVAVVLAMLNRQCVGEESGAGRSRMVFGLPGAEKPLYGAAFARRVGGDAQ